MLARSVTSVVTGSDRWPSSRILSEAECTLPMLRPVGTTLAPACAKPIASASPIPEVPPITTAVFCERLSAGWPTNPVFSAGFLPGKDRG